MKTFVRMPRPMIAASMGSPRLTTAGAGTGRGARHWCSALLMSAGGQLIRWAWHLAPRPSRHSAVVELEFCREAGAIEGAVYADGELLGTLPGVWRL